MGSLDDRGSVPGRAKVFLVSTSPKTSSWPYLASYPLDRVPGALSLGVTWLGHETDDSPPSNADSEAVSSGSCMPSWHSTSTQGQLYFYRVLFDMGHTGMVSLSNVDLTTPAGDEIQLKIKTPYTQPLTLCTEIESTVCFLYGRW
jgi:hypothetical protein